MTDITELMAVKVESPAIDGEVIVEGPRQDQHDLGKVVEAI